MGVTFQSSWKYDREVVLVIVGLVDVGGVYLVGASRIIDSIRNGRRVRGQQELRDARRAAVIARNIGEVAVVVELTARPRRLQCRELYVLVFDAHLEAVLAVNLGEVVGDLEGLADFVGGQEVIAAQGRQSAESRWREGRRSQCTCGIP